MLTRDRSDVVRKRLIQVSLLGFYRKWKVLCVKFCRKRIPNWISRELSHSSNFHPLTPQRTVLWHSHACRMTFKSLFNAFVFHVLVPKVIKAVNYPLQRWSTFHVIFNKTRGDDTILPVNFHWRLKIFLSQFITCLVWIVNFWHTYLSPETFPRFSSVFSLPSYSVQPWKLSNQICIV